ncbi:protein of unknown function [Modestobacter italicus]|uniref:Uncharacterized protein n=1 Tax=Modestobacter italicus (strain DSM 44449 / CECT 9708 / BC 501) TaxID=2732864 RepID=I4EUA3_MODI5|nr:protein of unknown function [Modestobacter marinus]
MPTADNSVRRALRPSCVTWTCVSSSTDVRSLSTAAHTGEALAAEDPAVAELVAADVEAADD